MSQQPWTCLGHLAGEELLIIVTLFGRSEYRLCGIHAAFWCQPLDGAVRYPVAYIARGWSHAFGGSLL